MSTIKKQVISILMLCSTSVFFFGCEELANVDNTVAGLKSALEVGVTNSVKTLSAPGGYLNDQAVKILLPEEAKNALVVYNAVRPILSLAGDLPTEETLTTLINKAAEDAAPKATNVFVSAIGGMTISDGKSVLFGTENAATQYLQDKTYTGLQAAFEPSITESLNTVSFGGYTPNTAWNQLANANNTVVEKVNAANPLLKIAIDAALSSAGVQVKPMETNLSNYVTGKALDGLFTKVAGEELKIRTDASARINPLLQEVFGQLDAK